MKSRLTSWLAKILQGFLGKLLSSYNGIEHENRIEQVTKFFYEVLPQIEPSFQNRTFIEGGTYNYFELPSGGWSRFDLVIPEVHIYVVVGSIGTATWEEARLRGMSRGDWEIAQADKAAYETEIEALPVYPGTSRPLLLFISWGDSVRAAALLARLKSNFGIKENVE